VITALVLAAACAWYVPRGVCYGDAGDLQTACATLGIAHPPGYVGFATVGWLLCRVLFFIEPAWVVSLACAACIVAALVLLVLLLIRGGLHPFAAGAAVLVLAGLRHVWASAVLPDADAPALACLMGAAYLLTVYARRRHWWPLLLGAGLLGFGAANRPPLLLAVPGFLLAWIIIERRARAVGGETIGRLLASLVCAGAPIALVAALTLGRDSAGNPYNYIEHYNELHRELPGQDAGLSARGERLRWLVTARQYHELTSSDWQQVRARFRYLRRQLGVYDALPMAAVLLLLAGGTWKLMRRVPEDACCAWGILLGQMAFLLYYRTAVPTADLLPVISAGTWLAGAGFAGLLPPEASLAGSEAQVIIRAPRLRACVALAAMITAGNWFGYRVETRSGVAAGQDATGFLARVRFAELPAGAVIFADWSHSRPLWYARWVTSRREDVRIVSGRGVPEDPAWSELEARRQAEAGQQSAVNTPVFCTVDGDAPAGWHLVAHGPLWRLERDRPPSAESLEGEN